MFPSFLFPETASTQASIEEHNVYGPQQQHLFGAM